MISLLTVWFTFLIALGISVKGEAEVVEYDVSDIESSDQQNSATCSLDGLPSDTSPTNRYTINHISDHLNSGVVVWVHQFAGTVNFTSLGNDPDKHYQFLSASWLNGRYTMSSNAMTKDFTRTHQTRDMYRHVVLNCLPDGSRVRYHLNIPLQDMTPPEFQQDEYNFRITANWNRVRPISEGQFVIVGDNAYEIQHNDSFLQYSASEENVLRVVPHRLWVQQNPEIFHYRLDLYLEDSVQLTAGQHFQIALSVKDQFNTGHTIVNIFVE